MSYQSGKIYKIVSEQTDKVYVGSTKCSIISRLYEHTSAYNSWKKGKSDYTTSYEIVQYNDAKIILLESYPCSNKDELRAREQFWINNTQRCVNKATAFKENRIVQINNFQIGQVYKIISNNTNQIYIGSTTQKLHVRLNDHISDFKSWLNKGCHYLSSFIILEKGDYEIVLLETVLFQQEVELRMKEQDYIDNTEYCVNKVKAYNNVPISHFLKCYRENNKEKIKKNSKEYYENNREKILERMKEYDEKNKEKNREKNREIDKKSNKKYYEKNKEQILTHKKEYLEENKETIYKKQREYREKNKEIINKRQRDKRAEKKKLINNE